MTDRDAPLSGEAYAALLDPDCRAAMALLPEDGLDWASDDPERLRAAYREMRAVFAGDEADGVERGEWKGDGPFGGRLGLRWDPRAAAGGDDAILYLHGGGWVVGAPDTHSVPCSHLAKLTGLPVLAADLRLAPEHRYPAPVEDAVRAARACLGDAPGRRIVIAGDSAGATLSVWTAEALWPELGERVAGVVAFYGAFQRGATGSLRRFGRACPDLDQRAVDAYWARLSPPEGPEPIPPVESAEAEGPDVWLGAAALDPLADDTRLYAARLHSLGRQVVVSEAEALPHGYAHFAARVPAAMAELQAAADWIGTRLGQPPAV